jgi:dihydroorotate dehydrogenase (NAD+) catalytic subunit
MKKLSIPFYDPEKTYKENFNEGPFGAFADGKVFEEKAEPQHSFLGQKVYLPFGIANGPLINGNFVKAALDQGFDLVEYKDVRSKKLKVNPFPNIVPLENSGDITLAVAERGLTQAKDYGTPITITNSFGIPSMDPDFWQPDLAAAIKHAKKGQLVIGGIQGTVQETGGFDAYLQDFLTVARLLKETGIKVVELNLSCPNEGVANLLCFDYKRSTIIVDKVKNELGDIPMLIKIAYFQDDETLQKLVEGVGKNVQGISAINTIPAKVYKDNEHTQQALPGEGRLWSGTCGNGIKWAGLEMVKRLNKLREKNNFTFSIEGVGGVTTPADYQEYKEAGADAVMSATGAMWNPYLAQEIKTSLREMK